MSRACWTTRALGPILAAATLMTGPVLVESATASPAPARTRVAPHATEVAAPTPLSVTLTSMTPSVIPRKGAVRLTGVVRNVSAEDWVDINVAPFVSHEPITTRDGLAEAAASAADVAVGERLTDSGTYAAVGDLPPGESIPFSLRVPVSSLGIAGDPGVYWIGVHALGANAQGRDLVADGRARTFIPLVTPAVARRRSVQVSVVLPLRERARRAADGSLSGPNRWALLTAADGGLARLVDFGSSAGSAPVSWLVDPAVLDALEDFGRGNPPLSLGKPSTSGKTAGSDGSGGQPSARASPSPSPYPEPGSPTEEQRGRARTVLETFLGSARTHALFTLGYADPDVASLARRRPGLIKRADTLTATRIKARGLTGTPTVAPPSGYFDPELLPRLSKSSLMVLTDRGRLQEPPSARLPTGQDLVLGDARALAGGPAPTQALDPLALRQRILSEAALEVAKGTEPTRPIVVTLPVGFDPGTNWRQADFFGGLQRNDWVHMTSLPRNPTTAYTERLPYGRAQLTQEIGTSNVSATRALVRTSGVLENLLATANGVPDKLVGAAFESSAYSARAAPRYAEEQVLALDAATREQLDRVQVTGTDFVTLSGGSGSLTVTLVNGLKQPITVALRARTDSSRVRVATPEAVSMQPGERTTLRLQVRSGIGIHEVTISPVTAEGQEVGTPLTFSLRTSNVGRLIWYIIFAGGALLAVMIVRRILLRIRNRRWRHGRAG